AGRLSRDPPSRAPGPEVDDLPGEPLEVVVGQVDRADLGAEAEAAAAERGAGLAQAVAADHQGAGLALDRAGRPLLAAPVHHPVRLGPVPVRPEVLAPRLVAEQDADLAAADHVVVAHDVVGVVVADRDAVVAVVADQIPGGQAVLDAPAPVKAD